MGVARPIAAGVNRLRGGPSFTTAYLTRSWSTSSAVFSRSARRSAVATADLSTLWICFAARFFVRSEEGRVGEEGRYRWAADHLKKKKKIHMIVEVFA